MTYAQATLSTLKQSLADRHDSGVLPTSSVTLTFWTRLLNRGIEYCADRLRLEKSTSLSTTSGSVALPDDFLLINRVFTDDEKELYQIDKDDVATQDNGLAFCITGKHTDGFTFNVATDDTYTIYYTFKPSPLSTDSDVCIIPDPEAVVAYAYGALRRSETDPIEDADKSFQECDARLMELQSAKNVNDNFIGFNW
jgi:hypothetical protein